MAAWRYAFLARGEQHSGVSVLGSELLKWVGGARCG